MRRRFAAIFNPISGRRGAESVLAAIGRLLAGEGCVLNILRTARRGHATELAAKLDPAVEAILAVGGDGTVSEIVAGLFPRTVPLLILASGTENLLACELAMPRRPEEIVRTLRLGEPFAYDAGIINGRPFLVVAGAGLDAECVYHMSRVRRGHINRFTYLGPIWRAFSDPRIPRLVVEVDGEVVFEGRGSVVAGVIGRYGGALRVLPNARFDDGLLDLCVLPSATRMGRFGQALRVLFRTHLRTPGVVYRQGQRFRITSPDPVRLQVDGEVGGFVPADIETRPGAVRFLGPPVPGDALPKKRGDSA